MKNTLARWYAALDLIQATDMMREVAAVNRITQADIDRVHSAEQRWDEVQAGAAR